MALPLRIRAEKHASNKFGEKQTFILPSKEENEVCLIIHDSGLVAVVVSNQDSLGTQQRLCTLLGINDSSSLPKYCLIIEDSSRAIVDMSNEFFFLKNQQLMMLFHKVLEDSDKDSRGNN